MNNLDNIFRAFCGVMLIILLGFVTQAKAEDLNPNKPIPPVVHNTPISYNYDLFNTGIAIGTGIPGVTDFLNISNPATWEYYRFCGHVGDEVSIEVHRTTSAMDPAMQTCEGTTADSSGIFWPGGCGSMGPFIASADDNNGIPHGVGGLWADPKNVFTLPATDKFTLMVFDFWGMGPGPTVPFEIHVDGVSPCIKIDIKPGSDSNPINTKSKGVIPVAILGSVFLDVTDVDVTTLTFGPSGAPPTHDLTNPLVYQDHLQDVNGDGFTDLVTHYRQSDTGVTEGLGTACLSGSLTAPVPFTVCDWINVVN